MRYFLFFLPLVFCACDSLKHQTEVDHALEDIGVAAAKEAVQSLKEDNADREESRREKDDRNIKASQK